jgi:hypothetical protein
VTALSLLFFAALLATGDAGAPTALVAPGPDPASGAVAGRVCEDLDGDGACGELEPGIPGARVLLSDGTFAVADLRGRYHLAAAPVRRAQLLGSGAGTFAREGYGRVLVKLDAGGLGRPAVVRGGVRRVVELGPAMLQAVDFAVAPRSTAGLEPAGRAALPYGEVDAEGLRYRVTGRTRVGHEVLAAGVSAQVGPDGVFTASVPLRFGSNRLVVSDRAPSGELLFYEQIISAVRRGDGEVLFIPGPMRRAARVGLPAPEEARVGRFAILVEAEPGARIGVGGRSWTVPAGGRLEAEGELPAGESQIAVELTLPGGATARHPLRFAARGPSAVSALAGVELSYDPKRKVVSALGRASAVVEHSFGALELRGGLDVDADDGLALAGRLEDASGRRLDSPRLTLLQPRAPLALERALAPELFAPATGDDGISGAYNPSGSRFYLRLRHPELGLAQIGAFHAGLGGLELGRFQRALFGAELDIRLPLGSWAFRARVFGAPPVAPASEPQPAPAHDEFAGTGGSLFFLKNGAVLPGSEELWLEQRDGLTGLPLERRALLRDLDYSIDPRRGRILLARPLPASEALGPLLTSPVQSRRAVLVVHYEFLSSTAPRSQVVGGEGRVSMGGSSVGASAVRDHRLDPSAGDYRLMAASAQTRAGPFQVAAEVAQSEGAALVPGATGGFSVSDTGGLSFLQAPAELAVGTRARAFALRASASEARWGAELWARGREAGFNDEANGALCRARQLGGSGRLELGKLELSALLDDRVGADPRDPLGTSTAAARDAVLRARASGGAWTAAAEMTYARLELAPELGGEPQRGERIDLGLRLDHALTRELTATASHRQRLAAFGSGPGANDDSFTALGAAYRPKNDLGLSVRGGWGPAVGAQVQLGAERAGDSEVAYGTWTVDVDGPDAGRATAVAGARRRVGRDAEVFAEDVVGRDVDALRASKAVGLDVAPADRWRVQVRYERGARLPFTGAPALLRDAGAARVSWLAPSVRASALAEVRRERGDALAEQAVDRWQTVAGLSLEAWPIPALQLAGRLEGAVTQSRGALEARSLAGTVGASLRLQPLIVQASYSVLQETSPAAARSLTHLASVRPSVLVGDRVRAGAGLACAFERGAARSDAVAGSARIAWRAIGPVEVAAEVARRSAAPAGQSLGAVRGEIAYWYEAVAGLALGYNAYGFSGTGVGPDAQRSDRVYLRLEAAY